MSLCVVGACSGDIFTHSIENKQRMETRTILNKRDFEPYVVTYFPGGRVIFEVNYEVHGESRLDEESFLSLHDSTSCIAFCAAIENKDYTVQLLASPPPQKPQP